MKVEPGVYEHNKTGHLYTVLFVGVYCGKVFFPDGPNELTPAEGFPEGTELVVYVGHYHNEKPGGNRVYVRPAREWFEEVDLPITKYGVPIPTGETRKVPRFTRVLA